MFLDLDERFSMPLFPATVFFLAVATCLICRRYRCCPNYPLALTADYLGDDDSSPSNTGYSVEEDNDLEKGVKYKIF